MSQIANTQCLVVGGGPAGLMLAVLLARAGVSVRVLEKHADFLRDFRGDTIHPSTMQVMHELGWLQEFLDLPHVKLPRLSVNFGGRKLDMVDFSNLSVAAPYIAMMPQWDFLNFLAAKGSAYPGFHLELQAEAIDLVRHGDQISGVLAKTPRGSETFRADLIVAADGRSSLMRDKAGLTVVDIGAPMDVLWFRMEKESGKEEGSLGRIEPGHIFIKLNRGNYWQCAYVFEKGGVERVRSNGIESFREKVAWLAQVPIARTARIASWDDAKLLSVKIDRLKTWHRPGLLCIGDAAHAMSPMGGVGVNLAVQDAVAAANLLWQRLKAGQVSESDLAAVERRRTFPTKTTQEMQVTMQKRIVEPVLSGQIMARPPWPMRLIDAVPLLRRLPGRLIGLGVRPEHVSDAIRRGGVTDA